MDSRKRGDLSEARVDEAAWSLVTKHPLDYKEYKRTSPGTDARGIDRTIKGNIGTRRHPRWMTIPFEIKSSKQGIRKWRVTHSDLYKAGVVHFYVRDDMNQKGLEALLYRAFDKVRKNSKDGTLYHSMWQCLYERRMSTRGRANSRNIAARRKKERRQKKK